MIPARIELFAFEAPFFGFFAPEQIQGKPTQRGQIPGGVAGPGAALILSETNVYDPMHFVLHTPVATHRPGKERHVQR